MIVTDVGETVECTVAAGAQTKPVVGEGRGRGGAHLDLLTTPSVGRWLRGAWHSSPGPPVGSAPTSHAVWRPTAGRSRSTIRSGREAAEERGRRRSARPVAALRPSAPTSSTSRPWSALVADVERRLGPIGAVVANATGPQPEAGVEELTWRGHLDQLEFFVKSPTLLVQAALPGMRALGGGRIIMIGSDLADRAAAADVRLRRGQERAGRADQGLGEGARSGQHHRQRRAARMDPGGAARRSRPVGLRGGGADADGWGRPTTSPRWSPSWPPTPPAS